MARRHGITALARRRKGKCRRVLGMFHGGRSALVQGAGQRGENSFLYFGAHADTSAASSSGERRDPSSWIRCPSALTRLPAALKKRPPCSVSSSFFAGAGTAGADTAGAAGSSSIGFGLVCGISLAPFEFLRIDSGYESIRRKNFLSLPRLTAGSLPARNTSRCWSANKLQRLYSKPQSRTHGYSLYCAGARFRSQTQD